MDPSTVLPAGYGAADAAEDRRNLATLHDPSVPWRTKRRLRHRVGDAEELACRLVAWETRQPRDPTPAREVVRVLEAEAAELARAYQEVCGALYGSSDPEVLANTRRIAHGEVAADEARAVIVAERERLARRHRSAAS